MLCTVVASILAQRAQPDLRGIVGTYEHQRWVQVPFGLLGKLASPELNTHISVSPEGRLGVLYNDHVTLRRVGEPGIDIRFPRSEEAKIIGWIDEMPVLSTGKGSYRVIHDHFQRWHSSSDLVVCDDREGDWTVTSFVPIRTHKRLIGGRFRPEGRWVIDGNGFHLEFGNKYFADTACSHGGVYVTLASKDHPHSLTLYRYDIASHHLAALLTKDGGIDLKLMPHGDMLVSVTERKVDARTKSLKLRTTLFSTNNPQLTKLLDINGAFVPASLTNDRIGVYGMLGSDAPNQLVLVNVRSHAVRRLGIGGDSFQAIP